MKKFFIILSALLILSFNCYADDDIAVSAAKRLRISDYNTYELLETDNGFDILYYFNTHICTATTDAQGVVMSYSRLGEEAQKTDLPLINKAEAKGNATVFISSAAGDILDQLEISTAEVTYSSGDFRVVFYRKVKGILFDYNYVTVGVDGKTGEITRYTRNYDKAIKFKSFNSVITNEAVFNRFKTLGNLELRFNKKLEGNNVVAYPVYSVDSLTYYNAVNGNVIKGQEVIPYSNYFDVTSMYEKTNSGAVSSVITVTPAEIQENIRHITELGITDDYNAVNAKYLANGGDKYLIVFEFANGVNDISVTVDSKTGVVCEFNKDVAKIGDKKTSIQLQEAVENYIDKYMADFSSKIKLTDVSNNGDRTVFLFERIVSGIPFKSNGACISVDVYGNITNISFLWDDIEFPSLNGIMSKEKAYNTFYEKCDYKLKFIEHNGEYIPVYALNPHTTGIIDAVSGDVLTYDGKVMQPKKYLAYIDLDSHYSKPYVEKMADCDIYVSRGNVALAEPIIQKDYLLLISQFLPAGKPVIENFGELTEGQLEMLYNAFIAAGVMDISEVDIEGYVTREKAVEYFIKTIGYGDVANAGEIFTNHFADSDEISPELRGYVELARGMGLISGNGTSFMPDGYLSNGDSLIIVYNYLSK